MSAIVIGLVASSLAALESSAGAQDTGGVAPPPIESPVLDLPPAMPAGNAGVPIPPIDDLDPGRSVPVTSELVQSVNPTRFVSGLSQEILGERAANVKVFLNPDGTRSAKVYAGPVHVQDPSGAWVAIDRRLLPGAGGRLRTPASPAPVSLSTTSTDPVLARVELGSGRTVGFGLSGAVLSPAVVTGDTAQYQGVWPAVDLELTASSFGVKEEIVLTTASAPDRFVFPLTLEGLSATVDAATGSIEYREGSGAVVARTGRGFMTDANVDPASGQAQQSDAVSYALIPHGAGTALEVTLDRSWLDDPARVYPVRVDPSVNMDATEDDTYVRTGSTADYAGAEDLLVGTPDGGASKYRSYLDFNVSTLDGKQILNADLKLREYWSWSCTASPMNVYQTTQDYDGHTMVWPGATTGALITTPSFATGHDAGCPEAWQSIDVTSAMVNWTNNTWVEHGVMLKAGNEADNYGWKRFCSYNSSGTGSCTTGEDPYILVDYNTKPTISSMSPTNGSALHDLTPTLSVVGSDADGDALQYYFRLAKGSDAETTVVWNSGWQSSATVTVPAGKLAQDITYYWHTYVKDANYQTDPTWVRSLTADRTPPVPALLAPAEGVLSGNPAMTFTAGTVTDPDAGDSVKYRFEVSTSSDGVSGRLATSNWLTTPTWTPPAGTFSDGGLFSWVVQSQDSVGARSAWSAARTFTMDPFVGARGSAYDESGAASVNLVSGNLSISGAFSYNSQAPQKRGLSGAYYPDTDRDGVLDPDEDVLLQRVDPQLSFNWTARSPQPDLIAKTWWLGRWKGGIRVPAGQDGDWVLVSEGTDDRVTVRVAGSQVLATMQVQPVGTTDASSPVSLSSSAATPIEVDYRQVTGPARLLLKIRRATETNDEAIDIPADWLTPTLPALPGGWSRTAESFAPEGPAGLRVVSDTEVVVLDPSGAGHIWVSDSGAWKPPTGESGTLTQLADGTWTLQHEDGLRYSFGLEGELTAVHSVLDDTADVSETYSYSRVTSGGPLRLATVTDHEGRSVAYTYGPSASCPSGGGFDGPAPANMLCKIAYSTSSDETRLYYSNGQLARVDDPDAGIVDFGYDTAGRLTSLRTPFTNELIQTGNVPAAEAASDRHKTLITYTADGKVSTITSPVGDATMVDADRPQRTYTYLTDATEIDLRGLSPASGYARRAEYDNLGRITRDLDAAGRAVTTTWDNEDRPIASVDPAGFKSTTIYNHAGWATEEWGPAPQGWFGSDNRPTAANIAQTPKATTTYDEGIPGLAATWYATPDLSGDPVLHTTSGVNHDWGAGSPGSAVPVNSFSGQLTGELELATAGTVTLDADAARLVIDDQPVIDTWGDGYTEVVSADDPVGWWRLGEASGTSAADASGWSSTGTYVNGVNLGAWGGIRGDNDTAASFDDINDYVSADAVTTNGADDPTQPWDAVTVEAWVKPTAGTTGTFAAFNTSVGGNLSIISWRGDTNKFDVWDNNVIYPTTATYAPGTWHHVAVTMTATTGQLYVDGVPAAAPFPVTTGRPKAGDRFSIGQEWDSATATSDFFGGSIDEVAVYNQVLGAGRIAARYREGEGTIRPVTSTTIAAGIHTVSLDYQEDVEDAHLQLTAPAGSSLRPAYGLVTSTTDPDGKVTGTEYDSPESGLPIATIQDPSGLNLRTAMGYEATGLRRQISRTLPKGNATTYAYYADGATADDPCTAGDAPVDQAGAIKTSTHPDPDGTGPKSGKVEEFRYDLEGRDVASRINSDPWRCTTYDSRGRVESQKDPAGRTATYDYSDPAKVTVTFQDSKGATRTTESAVDWLGRPVSYKDHNGTITRTTYDSVGRPWRTYRTFAGQAEQLLTELGYDSVGQVTSLTEHISGSAKTTTYGYDSFGRLVSETRPNGVVTTTTYGPTTGAVSDISHTLGATVLAGLSYTRSLAGRVGTETMTGQVGSLSRGYTYDGAGRLTQASDAGGATRTYAFDANTNRCANAATCTTPGFTYNAADQLLSSPTATAYVYDDHGNLTSSTPSVTPPAQTLDESFTMTATPSSFPILVGQAGVMTATLDWAGQPTRTTGTPTGNLAASASANHTVSLDGLSYLRSDLTWPKGQHNVPQTVTGTAPAAGSSTKTISATAIGTITASIDWSSTTTSQTHNKSVAALGTSDTPIAVSANGQISARLTWPSAVPNPNLDLEIVNPSGTVVASSATLTGNAEPASGDLTYTVSGVGAYPASQGYTLRVKSLSTASNYTMTTTFPATANINLELYNPSGTKVAQASGSTSKPESLSYAMPGGSAGTYQLKAVSVDHSAAFTISASVPTLDYASLTFRLKNPSGSTVVSTTEADGSASLAYEASTAGTYTLQITNNSSDLQANGYSAPWVLTTLGTDTWTSAAPLGASASVSHNVTFDGAGQALSGLTWTQGQHNVPQSLTGAVSAAGSSTKTISATAAGTITASVDWASTTKSETFNKSVNPLSENSVMFFVTANGPISARVTWSSAIPNPNLDLEIVDGDGVVVASSASLTGNAEPASGDLVYNVTDVGAYPGWKVYVVRVKSMSTGSDFTLTTSHPVTANLDLELYSPSGTKVAQTTSTTAKPEVLSYVMPGGATGGYQLKVVSVNHAAAYTVSASVPTAAHATLTFSLKDPSGVTVATSSGSSGSASLAYEAPAGGVYSLQITNNSSDLTAPSFEVSSRVPRTRTVPAGLELRNQAGTVVASTSTSSAHPKTLTYNATAGGQYSLVATATSGSSAATLQASAPGRRAQHTISYDANDHATVIDDGYNRVDETLDPGGRVLRRVVTDSVTGAPVEDVTYGYSDDGDSPAYMRPTAGGLVTTYLGAVTYQGSAATYQLANAHGDIIASTDPAGVMTALPVADEYGNTTTPTPGRLDWLGQHQRYRTGTTSGIIRMGVRLYDPTTGRFQQTDPIEGGSCNSYEYACGDPIGNLDLTGEFTYTLRYDLGYTKLSPSQFMANVAANFGSVFPITGKPKKLPTVGTDIGLSVLGIPFPVWVSRRWSSKTAGWTFGTRLGHPDHPGWIQFMFYRTKNGHMHLRIKGHVSDRSPAALAISWLFRKRIYREIAKKTWRPFVDSLIGQGW